MRNLIYFLMLLLVVLACKKDDNSDDNTPAVTPKFPITFSFDQDSDLESWQALGTTTLNIDNVIKFEGTGSMKLMDTVACHQIVMIHPIDVDANKKYQISLTAKFEGQLVCASIYNFALKLKQGTNDTLIPVGGPDWKTKNIDFTSDSIGMPLYIEFKLSNSTGWIDNLKIEAIE